MSWAAEQQRTWTLSLAWASQAHSIAVNFRCDWSEDASRDFLFIYYALAVIERYIKSV